MKPGEKVTVWGSEFEVVQAINGSCSFCAAICNERLCGELPDCGPGEVVFVNPDKSPTPTHRAALLDLADVAATFYEQHHGEGAPATRDLMRVALAAALRALAAPEPAPAPAAYTLTFNMNQLRDLYAQATEQNATVQIAFLPATGEWTTRLSGDGLSGRCA